MHLYSRDLGSTVIAAQNQNAATTTDTKSRGLNASETYRPGRES
jgi:hypothetical protein